MGRNRFPSVLVLLRAKLNEQGLAGKNEQRGREKRGPEKGL
jgi:hypothetical protein